MRRLSPSFVFLCETRIPQKKADEFKVRLSFSRCFSVSSNGASGGMILFWDNDLVVTIRSFSEAHIDSFIQENGGTWRFTGLYGNQKANLRSHSRILLRRLAESDDLPWVVGEDFNEILVPEDKIGGRKRQVGAMMEFRSCLDVCDLHDMRWKGYRFTWCNQQSGDSQIEERLDRFCANSRWLAEFSSWEVEHVSLVGSDHLPLRLRFRTRGGEKLSVHNWGEEVLL